MKKVFKALLNILFIAESLFSVYLNGLNTFRFLFNPVYYQGYNTGDSVFLGKIFYIITCFYTVGFLSLNKKNKVLTVSWLVSLLLQTVLFFCFVVWMPV